MLFSLSMVLQCIGSVAAFGTSGSEPAAGEEGGRNGEHHFRVRGEEQSGLWQERAGRHGHR